MDVELIYNARGSQSLDQQGKAIVERLGGAWRTGGGMCRCPAHDDRSPSLSVRVGEKRLLFHCFAGCSAACIIRALGAQRLLAPRIPDIDTAAKRTAMDPGARNRRAAAALWAAAGPIEGTPAEAYLAGRGLVLAAADLRFHSRTPCGRGAQVVFRPAMLAAVRDEDGLVALHRTFLNAASARLADMPHPKRALGALGQAAVRLGPAQNKTLGWAEGIETALSATLLTGISCWATLGAGRFETVVLPADVTRLVLFLDNDAAGRRAEAMARRSRHLGGIALDVRFPPLAGTDWNDVLLERARRVEDRGTLSLEGLKPARLAGA
jgi:putative DNA primase/helicase